MKTSKSPSHKKKRRLAADVKLDNAAAARKIVQAKKPRLFLPRQAKNASLTPPRTQVHNQGSEESDETEDSLVSLDNEVSPPTITHNILTPIRLKQNDRFYKVALTRLNLSFRSTKEVYANMIPYISKEIIGNFNLKYKRRISSNRQSHHNRNTNNYLIPKTIPIDNLGDAIVLSNYHRAYVEDYMTRSVSEKLLVMFPIGYRLEESSKWSDLLNSDVTSTVFEFTKEKYIGLIGTVVTNPMRDQVINGMHAKDYESGFGHHNYGCTIDFVSEQETYSVLLTWLEILEGRRHGIQVWYVSDKYREVFSNFHDRRKTSQGVTALFNLLYDEVYGDRLQSMYLMNCFNRATLENQNLTIRDNDRVIAANKPIVLDGEVYNRFLDKCNDMFGNAIRKCYTDFVVIGQPILSRKEINDMVSLYKDEMPSHYNAIYSMLGCKKKKGVTRNKHLVQSGYYDRQVFYNFLSMTRQKNPHKMINWAIISAGANYGRGLGDMINRRSTYLGASSTTRSFLRCVKPHADKMLSNIAIRLRQVLKTCWILDNNQKGHPKKFQRFGSSNRFVKVTGRTVRNCVLCEDNIGEENSKRVTITYIDQKIMNPINFPIFEKEINNFGDMDQVKQCLLRSVDYQGESVKLDLTGARVLFFNELIEVANTIQCVVLPLLTGYNKKSKVFKKWKHQPTDFSREQRNALVLKCHSETATLRDATNFQSKIVQEWNPTSLTATSLMIPPVSLRDEIKTNGYGMAIIEILCLAGLLIHEVSDNGMETWALCKDWEKRQVYLCMDGLSLDRHRSFQRKLINLPYSYSKVFKQSLIFQKALTKVIDISGPLHIAFHMLQSIFIIYKDMMKWAQNVVGWKKVNVNKVSESFDMCRQLCMLTLQEIERLSIDLFLVEYEDEVSLLLSTEISATVGVKIASMYNMYIHNMDSLDDRRLYFKGFIIMSTQFRNYWTATRRGDRITMESIQNKWIGVHLMSGKHKCVENYLNAIELEYKTIDNVALQEIRMNISVRYHEGEDKSGFEYPMHPLDEVQENINQWTKRLLMGPEESSWVAHSPNVASAHMCINFEESEFVKKQLDYSDSGTKKNTHRSNKTISPKKTREKERLYEFIVAMFKTEVNGRKCYQKDANSIIKTLVTTLIDERITKETDALDDTIADIFGETVELENTSITIHDDYTGIPDRVAALTDGGIAVAQPGDDTNEANQLTTGDSEQDNSSKGTVNKISLENVFEKGRLKMIEMKIPEVRARKQNRKQRSWAFFLEINSSVTETEDNLEKELEIINNIQLFNPLYRTSFRAASK